MVFKNVIFYRVSGPSAAMDFILRAMVKKELGFYVARASERRSGTEKTRILRIC